MGKGKYKEALFSCSSLKKGSVPGNYLIWDCPYLLSYCPISLLYEVFKVFYSVLLNVDRHPCQLVCKYGTKGQPYGTVKDGTRCNLDRKIKDVCIRGKCKVRQ